MIFIFQEMVTHVAKRWVNLARSEGMETKFIGVDWTTIMFTMEKGRDTTEVCFTFPNQMSSNSVTADIAYGCFLQRDCSKG